MFSIGYLRYQKSPQSRCNCFYTMCSTENCNWNAILDVYRWNFFHRYFSHPHGKYVQWHRIIIYKYTYISCIGTDGVTAPTNIQTRLFVLPLNIIVNGNKFKLCMCPEKLTGGTGLLAY